MSQSVWNERDVEDKLVRPAMVRAGWHSGLQTYGQFSLRAGRVIVSR